MNPQISLLRPRSRPSPGHDGHKVVVVAGTGLAMALQRHPEAVASLVLVDLTNEGTEPEVGQAEVSLGNSESFTPAADGWAVLSRYGDHPHVKGLQRFGRAQADEMVSYYKSLWNSVKRAIVGNPIYRGHPDMPGMENQYPDKTVYGSVADLQARDDGLYFKPVLTPEGGDQVLHRGAKYVSPYWKAKQIGIENSRPVFAPILLVSVGLTPTPNIAGPSLANSKETKSTMDIKILLTLLGLANEATEADVTAKITELQKRPESVALANEQTARTTAEGRVTELTTKLTDATTAFENERSARIESLVNEAVVRGAITEAAKPVWISRLKLNFVTESTALANEKGAVKTKSTVEAAAADARAEFESLVNEAVSAHGGDRTRAWNAVKATKKGADAYARWSAGAKK